MPITKLPLNVGNHNLGGRDTVNVITFEEPDFPPSLVESLSCWDCGAYLTGRITEDAVHIDSSCAYRDSATVIRLNVPSGKLIVTNDLRPVYDGYDNTYEKFAPYSSKLGISQVVEEFGRQGCAFGFVGSRWPDLFQTGDGTYVLASLGWDEELDDVAEPPEGWTRLADITGAVWSYSLADYEDWKARGGKDTDPEEFTVVEIPAGVYEFTYHGAEKEFDRDAAGTVLFTHIEKVA